MFYSKISLNLPHVDGSLNIRNIPIIKHCFGKKLEKGICQVSTYSNNTYLKKCSTNVKSALKLLKWNQD